MDPVNIDQISGCGNQLNLPARQYQEWTLPRRWGPQKQVTADNKRFIRISRKLNFRTVSRLMPCTAALSGLLVWTMHLD